MTRKLLMTAAVAAIALTPPIGIGTAGAHGGGFHGGGFHGRGFDRCGFFNEYGGFAPDYYGYGTCYLPVYGTTYCY